MRKYVITSAVPGATVNTKFLASLQNYCQRNNAKLLIIPTMPTNRKDDGVFDPRIPESAFVSGEETSLNANFRIFNVPISPQQIDPVVGLQRNSQVDGTFCLGSPKQRLKFVPNSNSDLPRALMSPGAVTEPDSYKQNRQGYVARKDHVLGAIVVDIVNPKYYHFRQLQASEARLTEGSVVDQGIRYFANGSIRKESPMALVLGDWHTGQTDEGVQRATDEMIELLSPEILIFHDLLDFYSRNHHHYGKNILNAQKGDLCDVRKELESVVAVLRHFQKKAKKIYVIRSNHDLALDRWLESGAYVQDDRNFEVGHELAMAKFRGSNPLQWYVEQRLGKSNVTFLDVDDDLKLSAKKIECGSHGHLGNNGARGTTSSIELAYARSFTGHTHTAEILRQAWVVGTSTKLKLEYNAGPSSWIQTHGVLYNDGSRQLINIIKGEWRADGTRRKKNK
jgi:hypothetical protein